MPGNILSADSNFPNLSDMQSDSEKIQVIQNYLYMLLEQLRYTMANLGVENFNETEFNNIANIITEPVYVQLKNAEGDIAALQLQAEGLTLRLQDAEGNITSLTATVEGMRLEVKNGEASSTISLTANGASISSQVIKFSGMVTFTDLELAGSLHVRVPLDKIPKFHKRLHIRLQLLPVRHGSRVAVHPQFSVRRQEVKLRVPSEVQHLELVFLLPHVLPGVEHIQPPGFLHVLHGHEIVYAVAAGHRRREALRPERSRDTLRNASAIRHDAHPGKQQDDHHPGN